MRFVLLGLILLTIPLFVALLHKHPQRRDLGLQLGRLQQRPLQVRVPDTGRPRPVRTRHRTPSLQDRRHQGWEIGDGCEAHVHSLVEQVFDSMRPKHAL